MAAAPSQTIPEQLGVSCQLLFCAITVDSEKSCSNGFANVPGRSNGAPPKEGPRALISTLAGAFPSMITPAIITLAPLWTKPLVEMLLNPDSVLASASKTSTNPTPVPPSAPLTLAV